MKVKELRKILADIKGGIKVVVYDNHKDKFRECNVGVFKDDDETVLAIMPVTKDMR